jgi:hypothetical protein
MNLGENQLPDLGTRTQYQSNITGWQQGGPSNIFSRAGSALGSVFGSGPRQARNFRTQLKQNIITGAVTNAIDSAAMDTRIGQFGELRKQVGDDPILKSFNVSKSGFSMDRQALGNKELAEKWKQKYEEEVKKNNETRPEGD